MKKIYIGCALLYSDANFRAEVENFKDQLRNDFEILDFLGLGNGTAVEVFRHDRNCILNSDLFVAICDYPSLGLGYEIATAYENDKKTLIAYAENKSVSRMILGIDHKDFHFKTYKKSLAELLPYSSKLLK